MSFLIILLIANIIPLGLIISGAYYDTKYSAYPETKRGYKNKYTVKDKRAWEYGNKLVSKIYGIIGTALLVFNTIFIFILGKGLVITVIFINFILVVLSKMIIEKLLEKKFK